MAQGYCSRHGTIEARGIVAFPHLTATDHKPGDFVRFPRSHCKLSDAVLAVAHMPITEPDILLLGTDPKISHYAVAQLVNKRLQT
ncbi:hypothetical protein A2702_02545 [Candidatus Amesbacteria bacterium RIFCSPHIGHO2_01_FULL_48_75]|nr:MAG: hypothetical protein A2702_02545 [Candidatus Amesbacteria bacterium RIFCSPHIGHO2_01_FULL_48_75]